MRSRKYCSTSSYGGGSILGFTLRGVSLMFGNNSAIPPSGVSFSFLYFSFSLLKCAVFSLISFRGVGVFSLFSFAHTPFCEKVGKFCIPLLKSSFWQSLEIQSLSLIKVGRICIPLSSEKVGRICIPLGTPFCEKVGKFCIPLRIPLMMYIDIFPRPFPCKYSIKSASTNRPLADLNIFTETPTSEDIFASLRLHSQWEECATFSR